ncbi:MULTISPECIES: hypothetical protein [Prevotellaceae]|uniref:hypothetical protein n=1 Tax=Prevotellaceae TaxID=171552 RepID=UPI0011C13BA7|nr:MULTISPECIES: hypothetical protein [Prevotellaceae]
MSRRCLIELSDGSKILAILTIPKPTKPIFPEKMEREFIESFKKQQPNMVNKVVKCHVMRN